MFLTGLVSPLLAGYSCMRGSAQAVPGRGHGGMVKGRRDRSCPLSARAVMEIGGPG
jgi:hypothetical protein